MRPVKEVLSASIAESVVSLSPITTIVRGSIADRSASRGNAKAGILSGTMTWMV